MKKKEKADTDLHLHRHNLECQKNEAQIDDILYSMQYKTVAIIKR